MRAQVSIVLICITLVVALGGTPSIGFAADRSNYTGAYSIQARKKGAGSQSDVTLEVVQTPDAVEVTHLEKGIKTKNRFPLNGSDGDYTSSGGVAGKCKAQLKDKNLVLESVVLVRPDPKSPSMRVHTKEQWRLSADSMILTVKSEVDFPDAPRDVSAVVGDSASETRKYIRTQSP